MDRGHFDKVMQDIITKLEAHILGLHEELSRGDQLEEYLNDLADAQEAGVAAGFASQEDVDALRALVREVDERLETLSERIATLIYGDSPEENDTFKGAPEINDELAREIEAIASSIRQEQSMPEAAAYVPWASGTITNPSFGDELPTDPQSDQAAQGEIPSEPFFGSFKTGDEEPALEQETNRESFSTALPDSYLPTDQLGEEASDIIEGSQASEDIAQQEESQGNEDQFSEEYMRTHVYSEKELQNTTSRVMHDILRAKTGQGKSNSIPKAGLITFVLEAQGN